MEEETTVTWRQDTRQHQRMANPNEVIFPTYMNAQSAATTPIPPSEAGASVRAKVGVPFNMVADALPKFTGSSTSNIRVWLETVSDEAVLYGWSPQQTLTAAKRALDGLAKEWLGSQGSIRSWAELYDKLLNTFERRVTSSDMHIALHRRRCRPDEDLLTYINTMECLGAQGRILEPEVREYIICGVTNDDNARLSLRSAQSRAALIELLEHRERDWQWHVASKQKQKQCSGCYKCHQPGHIAKHCKNEEAVANSEKKGEDVCYKCRKPGHRANKCRRNKPPGSPPKIQNLIDLEKNIS